MITQRKDYLFAAGTTSVGGTLDCGGHRRFENDECVFPEA
jgi:hypothetical protein